MKAIEVANYIIAKSDNVGDLITNKKLQKILYYIKAWGLVYFPEGVIDDEFEAWVHGPVCRNVYNNFQKFGYNPLKIDYPDRCSSSDYIKRFKEEHGTNANESDKIDMIDAVFRKYGQLTSLELELLTHSELPWKNARGNISPIDRCTNVISEKDMKDYYGKEN